MSKKNARYYTEGFTREELKEYYKAMLAFWTAAGDKKTSTYFRNKLAELKTDLVS